MAAFASRVGQPAARRSASCAPTLRERQRARSPRSTPRSRRRARSRARSCPACARRRRRSTPRSRGSSRRARWSARTSSAAWPRSSRRPRADLARADRPRDRAAAADRPRVQVRARRRPARPATSSIQDEFTTGAENYKEFFYALVGLAGEGQNFDGNGMYVRFQTGGGSQTVSLGPRLAEHRRAVRQHRRRRRSATGRRYPGKRPPYKPDVPCYKQKLPDVNGPAAAKSRRAAARGHGARPPAATSSRAGRLQACARSCTRSARKRGGAPSDARSASTWRTSWRSSALIVVVARRRRSSSSANQRLALPGVGAGHRQGLLRGQGRDVDRAGGHAGPGPDGQHRRRRGRRDLVASSSRTARRSSA